ncbi:MAG: iron-only hydrogenase system regulator [Clostridia bacterium]|nr:iron-only hydrogenase system regulator [Clostridia bacterium]MEE1024851.1 TM1266 family iron-only hydrogenase system putative regulator [Acutalibacteraceae bacterium]
MQTRVATISIIVENTESVSDLNELLHEYGEYIIGRMGIPYKKCDISIISVAVDAPLDIINALSGKIGKLSGVNAKTAYSSIICEN